MKTATTTLRRKLATLVRRAMAPRARLSVSEWAAKYRRLSTESSAEPGRWSNDRNPPMVEVMDAAGDRDIQIMVLMAAAQTGKTETLLNTQGMFITQQPGPILMVLPTRDMARPVSIDRFAPMIRDTPALRAVCYAPSTRDSNTTITERRFAGGVITYVGANSPAPLSSRPIRDVMCDEVDRFPVTVGGEGNPIDLAWKRTQAFPDATLTLTSTPTLRGSSQIHAWYERGDQRRYHVPCQGCGHEQPIEFKHLHWEKDEDGNALPDTTAYVCPECGTVHSEQDKATLVAKGRWVASHPGRSIRSYHLPAFYSPFLSWSDIVTDFRAVRKDPTRLQVWVNTVLAEVWDPPEARNPIQDHQLVDRVERYVAEVPEGVRLLTAGIDTQDNRLECSVYGWGPGEECWLISHHVLGGSPGENGCWAELDELMTREWEMEAGGTLTIRTAAIDSGGHFTSRVYDYVQPRQGRRRGSVVALKGHPQPNAPLISRRPSLVGRSRVRLWSYGTTAVKDLFFGRLGIEEPGPGYIHLPDTVDSEFVKQLLGEVPRETKAGRREYKKTRKRTEALDCALYARVALHLLGPVTAKRLNRLDAEEPAEVEEVPAEEPVEETYRQQRRKQILRGQRSTGTWLHGWKG